MEFFCSFLPISIAVSFKANPGLKKGVNSRFSFGQEALLLWLPRNTLSMILLAVDLPGPFPNFIYP